MTEVILLLVIIAEGILIGWDRYENRKERQKLIQAIMSKSAQDMVNFEMAEKVAPIRTGVIDTNPPLVNPEDFTAENELNDKEFEKYSLGKEETNG